MNIEEAIEKINNYINCPFNKSLKPIELGLTEAIRTLLTAYETLKDEDFSKKLSIDELVIELKKEKEKNGKEE